MSTMFTESMFDDIESNANLQEAIAKQFVSTFLISSIMMVQ